MDAMLEDGPLDLGDSIVWFKNGAIHRADGPAIEFKDGRKVWALNGKVVTEQEVKALHEANLRKARELRDKTLKDHEAEQQRQFHTGLDHDITVGHALKFDKKPADED